MLERLQGTVRWFGARGYAFIQPDAKDGETPKDVFVHFMAIEGDGYRTLDEGQRVEFEVKEGKKGPEAAKVKVIK